ncbi:hypothetical protein DXG03_007968 [Asterophora parasitica]|uniref:Uncharacterized protein n=1 Tax=Asterophora parasitica TaxID=117018 RepID=A0A9P7KCY7_9AGAR|nr:hypothetical protein DXG03_007968 [Asterophora parasitica]
MSTTSLPAYAKEPGEQELVIFRGPEDMEDAGMPPATVVMEPLSEEGEESLHSRNNSSSQYPPLPGTPLDEPLLENDSAADLFRPRQSLETLDSSEEASSLMRSPTHDPRGEAPPYFEAIDLAPAQTSPLASASLPASSEPARRSGFRTLLHNLPNRLSMHGSSHAPSHSRADSSFSVASSDHVHGRETPQSRASHRPSVSGSGSLLSLAPFRSLSRQKSINNMNLTSPSLISLNSISSPLTHTLTRTEFTYPKSGPTPEQLKLISSRESFARFGRPYGADAIPFAASASRQDLEDIPPPDFDSEVHPAPGSAGPSRLRTMSNAQELQEDSGQDEPVLASSSTPAPRGASMRENSPAAAEADTVSSALDPFQIPLPSSPKAIEEPPPIEAELALLALPKHSTQASLALGPPTSYRAPSTFEERSESRASSLASFATAAESMAPLSASRFGLSDDEGDDNGDLTTSTTPTMAARHTLEPTDAIVTQSSQSPTVVAGSSQ